MLTHLCDEEALAVVLGASAGAGLIASRTRPTLAPGLTAPRAW